MYSKRALLVALATLSFSSQSLANDWYVSGVLGKSWQAEDVSAYGQNIAIDPDFPGAFDSNDGTVYGIGLGYHIDKNLRLEARISYRDADFADTQFGTGARNGEEYQAVGDIESTTYTLEVFYDFVSDSNFKPYVKAGLGVARNEFATKLGGAGVAAFDAFDGTVDGFYDLYADQSDTNFAWNIGVGASYEIQPGVALFAEYQYISLGDAATGQDAFTDGFEIDSAAANEAVVGISFAF